MTNALCILLYMPLILAVAILLLATLTKDRSKFFVRQCIGLYTALLGWLVCEALCFIMPTPASLRYMFDLKVVFIAFVPVSTFFVFVGFYRLHRVLPKWLPLALNILPIVTAIMALISPLHSLLMKSFTVISLTPVTIYVSVRAPWFYALFVYSFVLVFSMLAVVYFHYKNLPKSYREGSYIMSIALLTSIVGMVAETFNADHTVFDVNVAAASIAGILFFVATLVNDKVDYLHIKRREVFHYLEEAVFVLAHDGEIIDANIAAERWLKLLDVKPGRMRFDDMLNNLYQGQKLKKALSADGHTELIALSAGYPLVFRMNRKQVAGSSTLPSGDLVVLTDVTNSFLFMERLREMVGVDQLTGLPNRYSYQQLLRELDTEQNLPLSIIIGDLNGLKTVNDTLGHEAGDSLLKEAARVLRECCPADGHAARIGGDEFVLLLPSCGRSCTNTIIEAIMQRIEARETGAAPLRIALGCATKEQPLQNINALISEADMQMYDNKR